MKLIEGYCNYYIFSDGRVLNKNKNKFLKPLPNKGYYHVMLCKNSKHKTFKIHRLVAMYYLDKIEGKEEVNHIDGNKANNDVTNLEWCNRSENNKHAFLLGLKFNNDKQKEAARKNGRLTKVPISKFVLILNIETGIYYDNIKMAANSANLSWSCLYSRLKRKNMYTPFIIA